jgi:PD-(D/E)XK nuclease superfamily
MAHLYVNSNGYEVWTHSFSGSDTFNFCPQKYKLTRVDGWNEIGTSAARLFGLALEAAIKTYHESDLNLEAGLVHFTNEWTDIKELHTFEKWAEKNEFGPAQKATLKRLGIRGFRAGDPIKYTATEGSWENLRQVGQEMLKLYHLRLPMFPIDPAFTPKFQVKYSKEVFPGTDMAGIEIVSYIDMLARSKASLGDGLIVDIKTSSYALDMTPGILALDQQLRTYAWITGVPDVAFLWFQKVSRELEKGYEVASLEPIPVKANSNLPVYKAGISWVIAALDKGDGFAPGDFVWLVSSQNELEKMNEAQGYKNGKLEQTNVAKERKLAWLKENAIRVPTNILTKQRIQFQIAHIGLAEQVEASKQIGQDVVQIVYANQENYWPLKGSIRGLDKKCLTCQMRGICLKNDALRDTLVYRNNEEWDARADQDE